MNLKDFLPNKSRDGELYWAVVIEPGWIQAGIWEVKEGKAEVISISSAAAWETDNELTGAADSALSSGIQNLPEERGEPTKTVFGVPPSWVSGGAIKEEHLERIKKICTELSLEPSGFVVLPEAISHLIKSEEGTPLNAIVIGIGKESLEIAVFKLGSLAGTTSVARSVSIVEDVSEGLSRFAGAEDLPSRFILYDGKEGELDEARQAIINVNWEDYEKIKFLHTPKVEILLPEKKVLATSLAAATELANITTIEVENVKEVPDAPHPDTTNPSNLGFIVGKDVGENIEPKVETQNPSPHVQQEPTPSFTPKAPGLVSKVKEIVPLLFTKITSFRPNIRIPFISQGMTPLFGVGFLFVVLILGFVFWWFYPKASVTIYVSPQKLEQKTEVVLGDNLMSQAVDTESSGDKTKTTSGTKTVGEKAKGVVKIQNGTASNINFPAGTILLAANNLQYTLESSASVSAALSPVSPGTVTVDVSASSFGAEYNLAKDESFKVGNHSKAEVDAVSTADFSGGSSREISAVSTEDAANLESDLTDELIERAKEDLMRGLSSDKFLVEESLTYDVSSRTFSHKVGDEAENLKLSLELNVSAQVVEKNNLSSLAQEILKDKVPGGYVLRDDQVIFSFEEKENESANTFDLTIIANLLPELKPDEIAKQIVGKQPTLAEDYLTSIPGFSRAEIKISPRLPGRLGSLPHIAKNIEIEIAAER